MTQTEKGTAGADLLAFTFPSNPAVLEFLGPFAQIRSLPQAGAPATDEKAQLEASQENFVFVFSALRVSIKTHGQEWIARPKWLATSAHSTCETQLGSVKSAERGMRNTADRSTRGPAAMISASTPQSRDPSPSLALCPPTRVTCRRVGSRLFSPEFL